MSITITYAAAYHTAAELCFLMGTQAAKLWKMPGEAFSLYSKIRVCSAPPWKATAVRLSCITTSKEPNRTSHTVMMSQCPWTLSPFTDWHLPSETCNFSGNSLSASCNALQIIFLQRKQKQKRKSSSFLPHLTLGIFLIQQQHCYKEQWEAQGQLMNFLSVLPMYCTVPSWCSCVSTFSYSTKFLIKK